MSVTKKELQDNIKKLEDGLNSPSMPEQFKGKIKSQIEAAKKQLAELEDAEKAASQPAPTPVKKQAVKKELKKEVKESKQVVKKSAAILEKAKAKIKKAEPAPAKPVKILEKAKAVAKAKSEPKKVAKKSTLEKAKQLAKKMREKQGISASKSNIEKDAERSALPSGKRFPNPNNPNTKHPDRPYYEYRENRIDRKPNKYPRLEEGGDVSMPMDDLKIQLTFWSADVYEDDYNEGEGSHVNYFENKEVKTFEDVNEFVKYISTNVLYKDVTKESFSVAQDGIISTSILVDSENAPASDAEIELWKQGEIQLYSANYNFFVQLVMEKEATEDELEKMFGADADGDIMARGGRVSYQKMFAKDGTVYKQRVKISEEEYQKVKSAIEEEITNGYPNMDKYVYTSGYEIYLKPIEKVGENKNLVFTNHTQRRFIEMVLGLNLKDRNTVFVVKDKLEDGGYMARGGEIDSPFGIAGSNGEYFITSNNKTLPSSTVSYWIGEINKFPSKKEAIEARYKMMLKMHQENPAYNQHPDKYKLEDGGYMARGGRTLDKYKYVPNRMIQEMEVERNGKTTIIDGADILDGTYVKKGVKFEEGGSLGEDGLLHALTSFVSSGTIANLTGTHLYKDIDGIRHSALQILQRDGDRMYSMENLKELLLEAKDEYFENKEEGSFAKGGSFRSRPKSAIMRDRKYSSQEEWEKKYIRKTPRMTYGEGKFENGGETHRLND